MNIDFRNWLNLNEASYTEKDIPPYFYAAIKFSEDLIKPKPYTPKGAVATLVGMEGISDSAHIFSAFYSGSQVGLQMPGKALLELNKVSKVNYDNPHYLTSAGFRTGRRLKAGSGGPGGSGVRTHTTESLYGQVINHLMGYIKSTFPDMTKESGYTTVLNVEGGETLTSQDITQGLKKLSPRKGVLHGKEFPDKQVWGQRVEKGGKNIKPQRARHFDNNLKNVRNINDLANRLMVVLRGVPGHERLMESSGEKDAEGRPIPWIIKWLKQATADEFNSYKGEKEWVMHRRPINSFGKNCPNCSQFLPLTNNSVGKDVVCPSCSEEFSVSSLERQVMYKPILNVPQGSILYLGRPDTYTLLPWARKLVKDYENKHGSIVTSNNVYRILTDQLQLYKRFEIHFVDSGGSAQTLAEKGRTSSRPHDPEKADNQEKLIQALKRGVTRVDMLEKLMEKKEGISSDKFRYYLERWQKFGIIKVDGNQITLLDPEIDEDSVIVYEEIKSADESSEQELQKRTNLSEEELKKALAKLASQDKVQKIAGGGWTIKLSPQEMQIITPLEQAVLDQVKAGQIMGPHDVTTTEPVTQVAKALRMLKLKGKIYKGPLTGYWKLTIDDGTPLSEKENIVIEYMKQWPVSDDNSIEKLFQVKGVDTSDGGTYHVMEKLGARGLVDISDHNSYKLITDKIKPHPDAPAWPESVQKVLELSSNHYFRNYREFMTETGEDMYVLDDKISNMLSKGYLKRGENQRLIPATGFLPPKNTVEGKKVIELLHHLEHNESEVKIFLRVNNKYYDSTAELLEELIGEHEIGRTYNPLTSDFIYHEFGKKVELNIGPAKEKFLELIRKANKPLTVESVNSLYNYSGEDFMTEEGVKFILDELFKEEKLKIANNFLDQVTYFLPDMEPPKSLDSYMETVIQFLKKNGPATQARLYQLLDKEEGIDNYAANKVISKVMSKHSVQQTYSDIVRSYIYYLEENPFSAEKEKEDVFEKIYAVIQLEPIGRDKLVQKMKDLYGFNFYVSTMGQFLNEMKDEGMIEESHSLNGSIYHVPGMSLTGNDELKILECVKELGGFATAIDVYKKMYTFGSMQVDSLKHLMISMAKKGTIYLEAVSEHDMQYEFWYTMMVSLTPIDDTKLNPFAKKVIEYLHKVKETYAYRIYMDVFEANASKTVEMVLKELEANKIVTKTVNPSSDDGSFWYGFNYKLTPQTETPTAPVQQAQSPNQQPAQQPVNTAMTGPNAPYKFANVSQIEAELDEE